MGARMRAMLRDDRGAVAIIVAVSIVLLSGAAALAVDMGLLYVSQSEMQLSADAAALAGAQELPYSSTATSVARSYALANSPAGTNITITTPYKGDPNKIRVICSRTVDLGFARMLGINSAPVAASAVATRKSEWAGEALPFINLNDDYTSSSSVVIWEKTGPGDVESINNYTIVNPGNPATLYFSIDYMNGVELKKGTVATIKQEIGYIFDRHHPSLPVYALSISKAAMDSGKVMLMNGSYRDLDNLGNGDLLHPSQFVLLECTFDAYSDKDKRLDLTVLNVYDIYAGELPPNYAGPAGASGSVLSR